MGVFARNSVRFGFAACLLLGLPAAAGCSSGSGDDVAIPSAGQRQAPDLAVELGDVDGPALMAAFVSDPASEKYASLVGGIRVSVDRDARHVELEVDAASSDTAELCAAGEAAARCLSDQARVTDADGTVVAPDDGPCGALYRAYDLSVRVQGLGPADTVDGLLPAGGDEVAWQ